MSRPVYIFNTVQGVPAFSYSAPVGYSATQSAADVVQDMVSGMVVSALECASLTELSRWVSSEIDSVPVDSNGAVEEDAIPVLDALQLLSFQVKYAIKQSAAE